MRGSPWAIWPSFIRQRNRETVLWFVQTNASSSSSSSSPPWTSCDGEWKLLSRGRQSSRVLFPSCPLMSLSHPFPSSLTFLLSLSLSVFLSPFRFIRLGRRASSFRASYGTSRKRWNGRSPMMFMNERSCDCAPSNWLPKVVHRFEGYFLSTPSPPLFPISSKIPPDWISESTRCLLFLDEINFETGLIIVETSYSNIGIVRWRWLID